MYSSGGENESLYLKAAIQNSADRTNNFHENYSLSPVPQILGIDTLIP